MSKVLTIPISETSNDLTKHIDVLDPLGFVRVLSQSDMQLFSGFLDVPSVFDPSIVETIKEISKIVKAFLTDPSISPTIVFTGCGTSGRIAYLAARNFNLLCKELGLPQPFRYFISGTSHFLPISVFSN
jgi:N-acetylmuramic acid 6-phosphate (MurNAc-6-P) etherase